MSPKVSGSRSVDILVFPSGQTDERLGLGIEGLSLVLGQLGLAHIPDP